MQLAPESVVAVEFIVPALLVLVFATGHILKKVIVKRMIFVLAAAQVLVVSLRPAEYNSDTWNYSGYLDALADAHGMEFLLLTKFEPLHLLLAAVARDFRFWLMLEALVALGLLWGIIRRTERLETLAIVIGTTLPLMSSSVRFAISLLFVSYVLLVFRQRRFGRFTALSLMGGSTHAANAIAGVLQKRRWILTWAMLAAFFVVAYAVASILERAGVSEDTDARPTGIRSFACLLGLMLYLRAFVPSYRRYRFRSDLLSGLGIFFLSALFFPVINRWLILLLVIIASESDAVLDDARVPRRVGHLAASIVYAALLVPFLYSVGQQLAHGEWHVAFEAIRSMGVLA